jgi:hypothetical protein
VVVEVRAECENERDILGAERLLILIDLNCRAGVSATRKTWQRVAFAR